MRTILALTTGLTTALILVGGTSARADYNESGSSSVKVSKDSEGRNVTTILTTEFSVANFYTEAGSMPILLKKTAQTKSIDGLDGVAGKLVVIARTTKKTTYDSVIWKLKEDANDAGAVEDGLYLTWQFGCCDSATTYRAYNLRTGILVLSYDDHTGLADGAHTMPFVVDVPNAKPELKRYIGILTESATRDFKAGKDRDGLNKLATITYSKIDGTIKKYDLFGTEPNGTSVQVTASIVDTTGAGKNEIRANHMNLWTSDGVSDPKKALSGFALKISLYAASEVQAVIPFTNDQLDMTKMNLPSGYRLVPASN